MKITFTLDEIYDVSKTMNTNNTKNTQVQKGLFFGDLEDEILYPIVRLIDIIDGSKEKLVFMSELIKKEILFILLNGKSGNFLKQYILNDSITNQIAKVIREIKDNYAEHLNIKVLADKFNISESSLYHNFKKMTMLSPLQFQKRIRLEEAKMLMLNKNLKASEASFLVGYESPSQFSREYHKMFGFSPKEHIKRLEF